MNISGWTPAQLKDFISQHNRDNPPRQGKVTHHSVEVQSSLVVNGQPIVGPNVFRNRFSASSGRGVPQGAFVDTSGPMARINDQWGRQTATTAQFYASFDKGQINDFLNLTGSPILGIGSLVYLPVDSTTTAAGLWCTNIALATFTYAAMSCAVFGPVKLGNVGPLVTQTANTSINAVTTSAATPPYPMGNAGIVEFPLPAVYVPSGVYAVLFAADSTAGAGVLPKFGMLNESAYAVSDGVTKSFFGETLTAFQTTSAVTFPWPSTLPALSVVNQPPWLYLRTS